MTGIISRQAVGLVMVALCMLAPAANSESRDLDVQAAPIFFDRPEFDSVVLVEFPFSLARHQFRFDRPDSADGFYLARIFAQVTIFDGLGMPVDSVSTLFSATVVDQADAARVGLRLFNSLALPMKQGIYSGRLKVIDALSKAEGEAFFERIAVETPDGQRLAVGGECLAYRVAYVGTTDVPLSAELRNGYEVYCNPTSIFSTDDSSFQVYAELYNLVYTPDTTTEFQTIWSVRTGGGLWRQLESRLRAKVGNSAAITQTIDIKDWVPGSYRLRLLVKDKATDQQISREWPFRIASPIVAVANLEQGAFVDPGDTLSLTLQLRLVRHILSIEERQALDRLTETGQGSFLRQYWQDHDTDPTTPINEFRLEMLNRYLYANDFFSVEKGSDDGWQTDRGRILLTYGQWDTKDDDWFPGGHYPYQVWRYFAVREGAVFVFIDREGYGDFKLVHSNVPGELYSSDWESVLRTSAVDRE